MMSSNKRLPIWINRWTIVIPLHAVWAVVLSFWKWRTFESVPRHLMCGVTKNSNMSLLFSTKKYGLDNPKDHNFVPHHPFWRIQWVLCSSWGFQGDWYLIFCLLINTDRWMWALLVMNKLLKISDLFCRKPSMAVKNSTCASLSLFKSCWAV